MLKFPEKVWICALLVHKQTTLWKSMGDLNEINNYIKISEIFKLLASLMSIYLIGEFNKLIDTRVWESAEFKYDLHFIFKQFMIHADFHLIWVANLYSL
mgnify:FL=1